MECRYKYEEYPQKWVGETIEKYNIEELYVTNEEE